jgi:hypothetical protein
MTMRPSDRSSQPHRSGENAVMSGRKKALVAMAVALAVVLGAVTLRVLPLFTGPFLPTGATRLNIDTQPPNFSMSCHTALLMPARVATSGDDLFLVNVESGKTVDVVWPSGFAAWRDEGRAVIADPWGGIVGRDGDVLDSLGGGLGLNDAFYICPFGIETGA